MKAKYKPTVLVACRNHPDVEAVDEEKRLCKNCLVYAEQGKTLANASEGKFPQSSPAKPVHPLAARQAKIAR